MIAAMSFVEMAGAVGVVAAALIGVMTLFERITGAFGRWLRAQHEEADRELSVLIRYHLGPNGDTPALWRRVAHIERRVGIAADDDAV